MAGLNVLKLMNDTTAIALAYGIYKQDLPETDKPSRNVVFVDCGHTGTNICAASFNKGKLTMLSCANANSGGRDFDEAICKYFVKDFLERFVSSYFFFFFHDVYDLCAGIS
jgi:molecular chaperone DnaK (HSP70)